MKKRSLLVLVCLAAACLACACAPDVAPQDAAPGADAAAQDGRTESRTLGDQTLADAVRAAISPFVPLIARVDPAQMGECANYNHTIPQSCMETLAQKLASEPLTQTAAGDYTFSAQTGGDYTYDARLTLSGDGTALTYQEDGEAGTLSDEEGGLYISGQMENVFSGEKGGEYVYLYSGTVAPGGVTGMLETRALTSGAVSGYEHYEYALLGDALYFSDLTLDPLDPAAQAQGTACYVMTVGVLRADALEIDEYRFYTGGGAPDAYVSVRGAQSVDFTPLRAQCADELATTLRVSQGQGTSYSRDAGASRAFALD